MRRVVSMVLLTDGLTPGGTGSLLAQQAQAPGTKTAATQQACEQLAQGSGMTDAGRQAIEELGGSGRGTQLMDRLMKLAKGMGNGDTVAGVERMVGLLEKGGALAGLLK